MILFGFALSENLYSQKTQYFDRNWKLITKSKDRKRAYYVRKVDQLKNNFYLVENFYVGEKKILASSKTYLDREFSIPAGKHETFYRNGKPKYSGYYDRGQKHGQWVYYWSNGKTRQIGHFVNDVKNGLWKRFHRNQKLWAEENYTNGIPHGKHVEYFDDGEIRVVAHYNMNKLDGEFVSYYENGNMARKEIYQNNELIEKQCYTKTGQDTAYFPYLIMPMYPGCENQFNEWVLRKQCADKIMYSRLQKDLNYPIQSRLAGREGTVIMQFNVTEEGEIKDPFFVEDVSEEIAAECLRLVNRFPLWHPGIKDGTPALTQFELPIVFRLGE